MVETRNAAQCRTRGGCPLVQRRVIQYHCWLDGAQHQQAQECKFLSHEDEYALYEVRTASIDQIKSASAISVDVVSVKFTSVDSFSETKFVAGGGGGCKSLLKTCEVTGTTLDARVWRAVYDSRVLCRAPSATGACLTHNHEHSWNRPAVPGDFRGSATSRGSSDDFWL